jgi:hypothetical protein
MVLRLYLFFLLRSLLPHLRIGTSTIIASDTSSASTSGLLASPCSEAMLSLAVLQLMIPFRRLSLPSPRLSNCYPLPLLPMACSAGPSSLSDYLQSTKSTDLWLLPA